MESFLNTFQKGLNSDYNVVVQPDGTYRYLRNCQLISQDGTDYTIKDCMGNTLVFAINRPYNGTFNDLGLLPTPICFISFPNRLIVLSTNNESEDGGYGEIGEIKYLPYGEGIQPKSVAGEYNAGYVPLYHSIDLKFTKIHRAEGFAYEENELIGRIYWTDNFNEPRVFNVSDPIFTTYIASGSLAVGQQYMVLEGAITHNAVNYGPGLTAGNVFTAANTNYTNLTGTAPTPKVIEYYPYQLLNFLPPRTMGTISFVEYGNGSLYCGNKMYFYRLGKNGVPSTSWSYGSSLIHTGLQNETEDLSSVAYQYFVGGGTSTTLLNSGKSIFVKIDNLERVYDYVELACAEFDQSAFAPRIISIVNRVDITSSSVTIEHTGSLNLGELTLADITLFPASILKCKTIATNKNYAMIGNLKERQEFDIDFSGITISPFNYPMNVHRDADSCSLSGMVPSDFSPVCGANPAAGTVTPWSRYKVTAGAPIYNGVTYAVGDVIVGVTGAGNDTIDFATTPGSQARPCVTRNNYTPVGTTDRRENAIEITGSQGVGFWDYKEPTVHHHVQGYWGAETYRFGILFYDKKGNPYYVRHLADLTIQDVQGTGGIMKQDVIGNTGELVYSINATGILIQDIIIPESIIDEISGFAIVRAERDARIMCQGIVTQCTDTGVSPKVYEVGAWIAVSASANDPADKVYAFISPDLSCGAPLPGQVGVIGDTMEGASWVDAYDYGGGGVRVRGQGPAASEQVYSKIITNLTADTADDKTCVINYWSEVNEGDSATDIDGTGTLNNVMNTGAAGADVIGTCVTGGVNYNLNTHTAAGCKKVIFTADTDFDAYNSSDGYTSVAAETKTEKLLMNYTKTDFSNPYGGTGEDALANTLYISTGHFQPITDLVKSETNNGAGGYTFTNIEIFGGDCFACLVDVGYGLWNDADANRYSYAWTFPCQCNSNYNLRRGRKTTNVAMYFTPSGADVPNANSIVYEDPAAERRLEEYQYNPGYTAGIALVKYPALPVNFVNSSEFKARIRYAGQKFIGEVQDSFRVFSLLDFKDLSVQNGRINNIKVKEDRVVVWQDLAVNTVPILERQLLSAASGADTTIGTGGVVDRFDIISSYFGNQHQWGVIETEYGFAWFDMHRKGFVVMGFDGSGLTEPSLVLGLQGFFSEAFLEAVGSSVGDDIFLNSPTFADTADRPLIGVGITGVYDPKFKMTYMTFKFKARKFVNGQSVYQSKDFTIGYLHNQIDKMFIGFYDWFPCIAHNHNLWVLSANNPKNTTQFLGANLANASFVVGETILGVDSTGVTNNREYICIANVTLDNVNKYPLGATGSTYWQPINDTNQLWVHNQPNQLGQATAPNYVYNKYFGRVVDNDHIFIINPNKFDNQTFYVPYLEQMTPSNVNYTDVYIEAGSQSAADNNISSTNRNYRFIFDKITQNLPLSSTGRIFNRYLQVRLVKHNWTTDPRTVTTSVKILNSIKSFLTFKR